MSNENQAAPAVRRLTCALCGEYAGRWQQHSNQEAGYGICRPSIDWLLSTRKLTAEEILDHYGREGINYAPPAKLASCLPPPEHGLFNTQTELWTEYRTVYPSRCLTIRNGSVIYDMQRLGRFLDSAHAAQVLTAAGYSQLNPHSAWWP